MLKKTNYMLGALVQQLALFTTTEVADRYYCEHRTIALINLYRQEPEKTKVALTESFILTLYRDGLTYAEIAEMCGVRYENIKYKVHYATDNQVTDLKHAHRVNRKRVQGYIYYYELAPLIKTYGKKAVQQAYGYSFSFFNKLTLDFKELEKAKTVNLTAVDSSAYVLPSIPKPQEQPTAEPQPVKVVAALE